MIKYYLNTFNSNKIVTKYLSENRFYPEFSFFKKFYYSVGRPLLPLYFRHKLQDYFSNKIQYLPNFIWTELIGILKSEDKNWQKFIQNLYPKNYRNAIILTHDVETQVGFDYIPEIIALEKKYGFKSSWNIVPYKYKIDDGIINYIHQNNGEIGIHGYNHDGKLYYSKKIFNQRAEYINKALEKYNAVGFRSPQVHRNLEWLQKLNILYDASCFDYDPFQPFPGGTGSIWPFLAGKIVELPYTLPQDHVLFYLLKQKSINIWKRKIDWIVENYGIILALTHPDYLIAKKNLKFYEELLTYLSEIKNTWHCLPYEIASYFKNKRLVK